MSLTLTPFLRVYERLFLLGWQTELDLMPTNLIEGHSLVNRPEELTDEGLLLF